MNRNSVRNRPTPSAPYSSAFAASDGLPTLASSGIEVAVLGGARLATQFLGCGGTGLGGFGGGDLVFVGFTTISPLAALTMTLVPFSSSAASAAETTATDATGARQNGGVGGRTALGGDDGQGLAHVERGGVGRGQVFGDEHERGFADRQSWSGSAHEVGDHALADVMQVGYASAW